MTDLTGMIRWNANFVRGLAESVLNRAKVIRSSLTATSEDAPVTAGEAGAQSLQAKKNSGGAKKTAVKKPKRALKKAAVKRAVSPARRTKRADA